MFFLLTEGTTKAPINETISSFIFLIVITIIFFGTMWFSERQRKKKQQKLYDSIKVGDIICTIGGITGVVKKIKDDDYKIEIIKNQEPINVKKWAIAEKIVK